MAKGGDFEREICKKLSLWWSEGKRDDIFYRTSASGARATMRKKTGKNTVNEHGDMGYTDPVGKVLAEHWLVEMKTGYAKRKTKTGRTQWCVLDLLDGAEKHPILTDFWNQVIEGSDYTSREPVLIFRRNQKQACIAIKEGYFHELVEFFGSYIKGFVKVNMMDFDFAPQDAFVVIMKLDNFLEWIPDIRPSLPKEVELTKKDLEFRDAVSIRRRTK